MMHKPVQTRLRKIKPMPPGAVDKVNLCAASAVFVMQLAMLTSRQNRDDINSMSRSIAVYSIAGVKESNSLIHCRQGYFGRSWNKTIPLGPTLPLTYPEAYEHPEFSDR